MSAKKHLNTITIAYCIGMLLVLFGHSHPLGDTYYPKAIGNTIVFIYAFHMPLFFAISGFLLAYQHGICQIGGGGTELDVKKYLLKKVQTLLIPYVVLSLIAMIPKFILSMKGLTTDEMTVSPIWFLKLLLSPRDGVWGHFWFIPTLLLVQIIGIGYRQIRSKIARLVIFIASFGLMLFPIEIDWFCITDICKELFWFLLAFELMQGIIQDSCRAFRPIFVIAALVISIVIYYLEGRFDTTILQPIITALMIYVVIAVSYFVKNNVTKFAEIVSKNQLSIYIFSWPFQAVLELIINKKLHLGWYFIFPMMFIAGLVCPLVVIVIYKKLFGHVKNKRVLNFLNCVMGVR